MTSAAYAKFQASRGEVADGFITLDAFDELTARNSRDRLPSFRRETPAYWAACFAVPSFCC